MIVDTDGNPEKSGGESQTMSMSHSTSKLGLGASKQSRNNNFDNKKYNTMNTEVDEDDPEYAKAV